MITNVEFPTETARPGEVRRLVVEGKSPIAVKIKCFTSQPPPPGYKPCPECGEVSLQSGEVHLLRIAREAFERRGGELHIFLQDADRDTHTLRIKVSRYDRGLEESSGTPLTQSPSPQRKRRLEERAVSAHQSSARATQPAHVQARCC